MRPTQLTELFANIRKTFVSFFSILMFVALGVGIYLGISWVAPALQIAADEVFDAGSFHDFQIQFPYGLTDDDLEQLKGTEGVSDVEAGYLSYQAAVVNGKKAVVKLQSIGERIDTLSVMDGALPGNDDEIALSAEAAREWGIALGDSIAFERDTTGEDALSSLSDVAASNPDSSSGSPAQPAKTGDSQGMRYLNGSTYKVTALVHSPEYITTAKSAYGYSTSVSGAVDAVGWVPRSAFNPAAFQDGYPVVGVRCDDLRNLNTYSEDYRQRSSAIQERIAALGTALADERYKDLHGQAQGKIDEADREIASGKEKIAQGEEQLANGRSELEQKRTEANTRLEAAYQQLVDGQARYDSGLTEYNRLTAIYDEVVSDVESAKAKVEALAAEAMQLEADYQNGRISQEEFDNRREDLAARAEAILAPLSKYEHNVPTVEKDNIVESVALAASRFDSYRDIPLQFNGETMTLNQAAVKLAAAKAELDRSFEVLQNGWSAYYSGIAERDALVAEAETKIADSEKQIEDGKARLAESEPKLESAKEQVAAMKDYEWTVLDRSGNISADAVRAFGDVTTNLSFSMALLFVIVGLLVSYSAVSRIVHEQVVQIGTKKALGLRGREITSGFLLYAGIAVLGGAVIGTIVGVTVVEGIIAKALGRMFTFGAFRSYFGPALFVAVTLLELVLVLAATWLACRGILKKHAVELLRGDEPPKARERFYERWRIWEKLPLLSQTIVNNCVNDKRRVFSTIVGVAGCTALIVTAITLNNDVLKSYNRQYEEVYSFNSIAYADPAVSGSAGAVEHAVEDAGGHAAQVLRKGVATTLPSGDKASAYVVIPADDETFKQVYHVNEASGGEADLSGDGVWVTQAYRDHFGANVGDTLVLNIGDGAKHEVPILGFYDFWLTYCEMVMGRDCYEREFGVTFEPNAVLGDVKFEGGVPMVELGGIDGFDSITDDKSYQYGNFATFSTVSSAVVLIYLILSALMAVVVLLNLNVMFIDEKKRELIVLMINGFSVKDAKCYIYNDTIVLTAFGIVLGVVLGCVMGSVTVGSMEPPAATFVKDVDMMAVLVGILGSAALAAVMCIIALRRIPRFALTDINKQG